ncbi:MAG: hypothetical protein MUO26_14490 [Methanotrichaceae archaeon]|nr:hypothetical protein [Methanotrichaceae archaeon]
MKNMITGLPSKHVLNHIMRAPPMWIDSLSSAMILRLAWAGFWAFLEVEHSIGVPAGSSQDKL